MSSEFNENSYSLKMDKSIHSLKKDISTLRTGRANPNMLDTVKVDVYGQMMPIDQLATVSVPEARLISIQVWDKANKILKNMGEKGKVSIRNIRREANEDLKKKLKDKLITEDENKSFEKNIQKLTDNNIENIDKILTDKEKEILQI